MNYQQFEFPFNMISKWTMAFLTVQWNFFNRKKSSCLDRSFSSSFKPVKTIGYLYEAFEIHEKGTSAKKVTLRDAKEDVDKICIEVAKKPLTNQVKNLLGFSLYSDTKQVYDWTQSPNKCCKHFGHSTHLCLHCFDFLRLELLGCGP